MNMDNNWTHPAAVLVWLAGSSNVFIIMSNYFNYCYMSRVLLILLEIETNYSGNWASTQVDLLLVCPCMEMVNLWLENGQWMTDFKCYKLTIIFYVYPLDI